jgi:predicted Zn-dependent protease
MHNPAVAIRLTVRLVVAVLCAAGIVASLVARDSRVTREQAFKSYVETRDVPRTLQLLDDARPLNPDFGLDVGEARLKAAEGVAILEGALRREPENAELWVELSRKQQAVGDRAGARRSWARARELAPLLPPGGP